MENKSQTNDAYVPRVHDIKLCEHKGCYSKKAKTYERKRGFWSSWFTKTEDLPPINLCEEHGKNHKLYENK